MICVPHCSACPATCTGLQGTPASAPRKRAPRNPAARFTYVHLKCGHIITSKEVEVHAGESHPRGKPYYCDKCWKWQAIQPKPKRPAEPEEPLY